MNCDKYQTQIPYPDKRAYTKTFYYKEGVVVATSFNSIVERAVSSGPDLVDLATCVKESLFDRVVFEKARDLCMAEQAAMNALFKKDLFAELGIANNPHAEKLFAMAYERGHSSGFNEIYTIAAELSELIT